MTADKEDILVVHALGVHPDFAGNGFGKELVKKVIDIAKSTHKKAIRLDVLEGNVPCMSIN